MADYAISNVARRVVYANTGVGPYAFTFEILANTDIAVYRGSTLLTLTTDYSVTINANGTGSVTLVTAGTGNITIVGARAIQRTSDYTTGGDLFASTLNTDLDSLTIYVQQVAETAERGLKAPVVDPTDIAMTLPAKDNRKGKVLAFDSTTGNPVAGPALDAVTTVIAQSANINTVADNIASVNTVAGNTSNINTVAGVSSNVTTVAGSISNVNTVASDLNEPVSEINTVATDIANVNTVGTNIANVNTVAGNSTNINTVAGISGNVTTVAGISGAVSNVSSISSAVTGVNSNSTNINTVAGQISPTNNIATVAGVAADVDTVAGISANVTSVAGNSTNINTVATNIANVNSVGGNIANVNSVAGNSTNINNVAGNSANINTVAGISSNVTTVATNNANVTTVATNIANVNTNATNIANINQNAANIVAIQGASANATNAANSATAAASSATSASASAAAASAVALGNEPVRHSVRPSLLLDFANTKTLDPRITFTRASTGTFYDGKTVAKAEENFVLYSQEFDNAWWVKAGATITANSTTAPDGTTTADSFTENVGTVSPYIARPTAALPITADTLTFSAYAKANGRNQIALSIYGGAGNKYITAVYDLSGVSVSKTQAGTGGTIASTSITSVGSGWYRLVITGNITAPSGMQVYFYLTDSTTPTIDSFGTPSAYTGNGTSGVYLWGAQLEQRSSVTAYTATTTAPITNYIPALQTAASGVARFEHNPVTGESLGLEIEEQRTNLLQRSEDFANAYWANSGSTTGSNVVIAPDGTLTADQLIEGTTSGVSRINSSNITVVNGTVYTLTVYAKSAGRDWFVLQISNISNSFSYFNVATGAIGTVGAGATASITAVGNGWYRCAITSTSTTTSVFMSVYTATANGTFTYTGNGYSGMFFWGAQLEAGSFATSYIPTVASQVTRSVDSASMTGTNFSSWYNASEGTLYSDYVMNALQPFSPGLNQGLISLYDGSGFTNSITLQNVSATTVVNPRLSVFSGGSTQADLGATSASANTAYKLAGAYKTNDFACSLNAGTLQTDALGTVPQNITTAVFGYNYSGTSRALNGTIKKIAYYPKRLTNAELQGLTTI